MPHPRAKCHALNHQLETCGIDFARHRNIKHEFEARPQRRMHVLWPLLNVMYCGRRPQFHDALGIERVLEYTTEDKDEKVRQLGRDNLICNACFKSWLYLKNRKSFLGARNSW